MNDNNDDKFITKKDEVLGEVLSHAMKESKTGDCPSLEDIASLVDGYMGEEERERIMTNLSSCDECYETFLLSTQIKEKRWKKRSLIFHPIGLAASVIIVAFLAFLVYKSGFFPKSGVEMEKKPEEITDYSIPKEEFKTAADKEHVEKKEMKKMERGKGVTGETSRLKRKKGGPAPVSKMGEELVRKETETEFKPGKMTEKKGKYTGYEKRDRKSKTKDVRESNDKPRAFQEPDRSVQTFGKKVQPPKRITEQQVQPKVTQKTVSDKMETVQKEEERQKGIQQGVVQVQTAGAINKKDEEKLQLSSSGLHVYCAGKEGEVSIQFLEHQSVTNLIEKPPTQVKGVLPDKRVFKQNQQWGMVVIEVEIDQRGNVKRACALKGDPELVRRTVEEVLKWKYEPVKVDGKSSPVRFIVKINYR